MSVRIANLVGYGGAGLGYEVPDWAVGPGFSSEVVITPPSAGEVNELDFALLELVYADTGIAAAEAGFGAILINTVADLGVRQMRAALQVPVVGCGQAAMLLATGLGKRFAIVTIFPPASEGLYARLLIEYGLVDRCVGVWFATRDDELDHIHGEGGLVPEIRAGRGTLLDRVTEEARKAVAAGADAIVLGCTCMSPVRRELAKRVSGPVIDPLVAGHKLAETLVSMDLRHGDAPAPPLSVGMLHSMIQGTARAPVPEAELCGDACSDLRADVVSEEHFV